MKTIEHEVLEKFKMLDKDAQQRVKRAILEETEDAEFDYEAWFAETKAMRDDIRTNTNAHHIDVVSLLRDIRDGDDE